MESLGVFLYAGILVLLILKYIKNIYSVVKNKESVEYVFKFNVNLNKKNRNIVVISSIINIVLLILALYYYTINKNSMIVILVCSLFIINISFSKNLFNKIQKINFNNK